MADAEAAMREATRRLLAQKREQARETQKFKITGWGVGKKQRPDTIGPHALKRQQDTASRFFKPKPPVTTAATAPEKVVDV